MAVYFSGQNRRPIKIRGHRSFQASLTLFSPEQYGRHEIHPLGRAQDPDHHNGPAQSRRLKRLLDRRGSAHFDHKINALAARQPQHLVRPVRRRLVVDQRRGAHFLRGLQLLVAARRRNHPRARRGRKLDCKTGHAARALRQHRLTRQ